MFLLSSPLLSSSRLTVVVGTYLYIAHCLIAGCCGRWYNLAYVTTHIYEYGERVTPTIIYIAHLFIMKGINYGSFISVYQSLDGGYCILCIITLALTPTLTLTETPNPNPSPLLEHFREALKNC
jgi:hypothetical protein